MRTRATLAVSTIALSALALAACRSHDSYDVGTGAEAAAPAAPFGTPQDEARARNLWNEMAGYRSWPSYPGFEGWQNGRSPHGKVLRYYINGVAAANPADPGYGSIIVKENFMDRDEATLAAITVMKRIRGYDPEDHDWFWVKFGPNGEVMKNPAGMALAGRVAKGMSKGCIACHTNAGGNDFLFVND